MAFRAAVEDWGAEMLELDVHASADGRVVVIHDATLERTTDGTGRVADHPWAALRELDAGYRFRDPAGHRSFRARGVRIPLFEELLEALPRSRLNVEVKDVRAAPELGRLVRRHGAAHRVLVAAEREANRAPLAGYAGPWGASARQLRLFWALHRTPLSRLYTPRADVLQVPHSWKGRPVVTPRLLEEAHARNLAVHVWTVDEPEQMQELLRLGVDGIQTDRPDRMARVWVDTLGRPAPPALRAEGGSALPPG